ncbi:MFS transporter [Desulfosporosinus sp. PR]|uniref:MDR family MFS transporter n=1 Tax=Candidatus Desulfosporosinus nitrosoreducens TaxID=3401928 RepID=UPI0027FB8599|nr:MFS transporter [Desulfosporosinus sp. PR]MDQ7094784.1 MFS transporter [Desulfosporosinus sp. PR]
MINSYRGLPKSIYVFFVVQVINRFGDFVVPFLTLYLTRKLGLSFETTGVIVMVASALNIPSSLLGGNLADRLGRKKVYILAQTTAGILLVPCAFLTNPFITVACILTATFFNGAVRPAVTSMIADLLPPYKRQLGYSLNYLGVNVGVALGPLVAGFLFNHCLPLLFIGDALTSFIAVGLVMLHISEVNPLTSEIAVTEEEKDESGSLLQALRKRPKIVILLLIYIIYCAVYVQNRFSLPIMLDKVFQAQGPEKFGLLMSVNALTVIILTLWITDVTRRLKPLNNMVAAGLLYAVGFGMIGSIHTFFLFVVSTVLWTLGEILMATNFGVYVSNHSPRNYRARFNALSSLTNAIGGALGTSLMGVYIGLKGINAVWSLIFGVSCLSSVLMLGLAAYSGQGCQRELS